MRQRRSPLLVGALRLLASLGAVVLATLSSAPLRGQAAAGSAEPQRNGASTAAEKPNPNELLKKFDTFTNSVGMVLVRISPTLWAGQFEVTQAEYAKVVGANPSRFPGAQHPVDSVSWNDAMTFCRRLNDLERQEKMLPDGFAYRLPTQQEWTTLMGDADLKDAVTSRGVSRTGTAPVGSLGPNSRGLYDTRGNVWEFCLDPQDTPYRVLRGAAWNTFVEVNTRPEFRYYSRGPEDRQPEFGFRVVLAAP